MTTQLSLPGLSPPDPLTAARDDLRRARAAWQAVSGSLDAVERYPAQVAYWAAMKRVERLELGFCWWHGGKEDRG